MTNIYIFMCELIICHNGILLHNFANFNISFYYYGLVSFWHFIFIIMTFYLMISIFMQYTHQI